MKNLRFSIMKFLGLLILMLMMPNGYAQLTGIKNIPGDYPNVTSAVTDLNLQGVGAGGVTFNVAAGFTESTIAPIIVTATGTAANPIVFQKSGAGANPIITRTDAGSIATATLGGQGDAILQLDGTDYITFNAIDVTAPNSGIEYGYLTNKPSATDGCQNVSITNSNITMTKGISPYVIGIYISNGASSPSIATGVSVTALSGENQNISISGNTITNVHAGIVFRGSSAAGFYDENMTVGTAGAGNTITNFGGASATTTYGVYFIYVNNASVAYNTINNIAGGGTAHGATLYGIFYSVVSGNINGSNNAFTISNSSTSASYAIYQGNLVTQETYNSNTFASGTISSTGVVYLLYASNATTNKTVNGNSIAGSFTRSAAGTIYGYYNLGAPTSGTETVTNNQFTNITNTAAGAVYLFYTSIGTLANRVFTGNIMSNVSSGTGSIYCGYVLGAFVNQISNNTVSNISTGGLVYAFYNSGTTLTHTNNTVNNITVGSTFYGIYAYGTTSSVTNNSITGVTETGTGAVYGVYLSSTCTNGTVASNTISGFTSTGSTLMGMYIGGGTSNVNKNKIVNFNSTNATTPIVSGINVALNNANLTNNIIGDLRATAANSASGIAPSVRGVNITSATANTNINLYHNTIYLSASSTGANYSTAGVFATNSATATTARLKMIGNIVVNLSTPNGTGIVSAYTRSAVGLNNFDLSSNNNLYYSGVAATNLLIFYDGTNSNQTLSAYQTLALAENNSYSFLPNFLSTASASPTFVHIDPAVVTVLESGSIGLGLSDDIDGDIRALAAGYAGTGTAPDVGADEFIGISPAPVIVLASIVPAAVGQCTAASRTVTATITTLSGSISSATLNYSFNGTAQPGIPMVNTVGNTWTATLPVASPTNAIVSWTISATNTVPLSATYIGTTFQDDPLLGVTAIAANSLSPICAGSPSGVFVNLSYPAGIAPVYTAPVVTVPTTDEDFGNITLSQFGVPVLNNTSSINSLTGTLGIATGTIGSYSDFSAFGPFNLVAGQTVNFSATTLTTGPTNYNNHVRIYIDLNKNGSFADAGECMYFAAANVSGAHTETGTFTIPLTAVGITRMRVMAYEGTPGAAYINSIGYGEFEDYTINISNMSSVTWSDGVSTIGSGISLAVNPIVTTSYTATVVSAGCTVVSNATTITVNPLPASPSATNSTQCGLAIPTASVSSNAGASGNGQFYWMSAATNGSLLQTPPTGSFTTFFSDNFSGGAVAAGASTSGSANLINFPGELQLFNNLTNQIGGITVNAGVNAASYMVDFDLATSTGADGVSYSFGDDVNAAATSPTQEMGSGSKLKISFDAYGAMPNGQGIYLLYNSIATSFNATSPGVLAYSANTSWVNDTNHVAITIDNFGKLTLSVGATTIFSGVQLPATYLAADKSTWKHVISGRTGGIAMMARIDNLLIQYANNQAGYTSIQNPINATTTYYVTEQGTNGCYSVPTPITVTVVNPDPITITPGGTGAICLGQSFSVNANSVASPSYTYSWDANTYNGSGINGSIPGAAQTFNPYLPGVYTYTITGTNGVCTATSPLVLTVNALPVITTATAAPINVCNNSTVNLVSSSFVSGPQTLPAGYCAVTNLGGTGSMINNFTFNTISNNTAATNPVASPYATTYNLTTTVNIGQTYPLTVTIDPAGVYTGAIVSVWIDYNRDGVYAATEWQQVGVNIAGGNTATISVTIPANAVPGLTGLRLRSRGSGNVNTSTSSCLLMGSGETEDYQVNIQAAPANPYNYSWNTVPPINSASGSFTATNNTGVNQVVNYIVTATDQVTGCVNQDTTNNITIYPAILAPTVVGSSHCGIQIPTATANDVNGFVAPNYNWYATPVNANPLQSSLANTYNTLIGNTTTLYVSVTDNISGCETSSTPVTVTVTPGPALTLANTSTSICVGNTSSSIGLSAGVGTYNSFTWSPAAGVSGNEISGWTFNPAVSTIYTLTAAQTSAPNCSNQDTIAITVDQVIPPAPTVAQNIFNVCSGANSVLLSATAPVVNNTFTYTLNFFDSFGDGWNGNTINVYVNGVAVLNGVTLPMGSNGSQTFTVNGGQGITTLFNAIGSWIGECTYNITDQNGNVIFSGTPASAVGPPNLSNPYIVPIAPQPNFVINWYNASANGANVGSGSPLQAVGTTVMPVATNGTYMFYAGLSLGACNSATTVPVTVNVADVAATLNGINSCVNATNGTFTATNFTCGTAPFTYSVNNGAFGAIPTNLAAGTYSVVIRDANLLLSPTYTITIGVDNVIPPAPTVPQALYSVCSGVNSVPLIANPPVLQGSQTYTLNFFDSFGDGWNGNTIDVYINGVAVLSGVTLPMGSVGTATFTVNNGDILTTQFNAIGSWINECTYSITAPGGAVVFSGTPASPTGPPSLTNGISITTPAANPQPNYILNWYNASVNGTNIGSGSPLEAVGTSVMPTAANGTYTFYVGTTLGACNSATTVPVTVNVADVAASVSGIAATCNGVANGSFNANNFTCGTAPFVYSVNNGPFGPIPTNLPAGTHTVVIRDANNLLSSPYTITITQPAWSINTPISAGNGQLCVNDLSEIISANATINGITTSVIDTFIMASNVFFPQGAGGTQSFTQNITLPAGAVVTGTQISFNNVTTSNVGWPADYLVSMTGASTLGSITLANVFTEVSNAGPYLLSPTLLNNNGGNVTVNLTNTYAPGVGLFGNIYLIVTYSVPANVSAVTWWNSPTGGNQVAIGSSIESVGTSVLPNSLTPGVYNFYAQGEANGCSSLNRTLVTVTVNALPNVNAGLNQAICIGQSTSITATGAITYTWNNGISNGVSFTPNTTNNYIVTGVDNNGCINYDTVTVVVNALPNVSAGNNQTICLSSPVTLSGTGATSYVWNNNVVNNVPFTPTTTNNYVVTGTDANGCVNTDTVTVSVLPLPIVDAGQNISVCLGAGAALSGSGAVSYVWNNGVTNNVTFFPNTTQYYTVIGTGANGCTSQDSVLVTVNTVPSITLTNGGGTCANGTVNLDAATVNAFGGFWSTSNGTGIISPNVSNNNVIYEAGVNDPNTVTFTFVAFNQCGSSTTNTSITVLPIPSLNAGLDINACTGASVTLSATSSGSVVWNNGVLNGVAFAAAGGSNNYVATATAANGCTNTDTVVVNGLALPQVNAGLDQSICAGEFVTLTASGAISYAWNNAVVDGIPFAPNATSSYTVTGTDANGCTNQDNVTVTVNAVPNAVAIAVDPVTLVAASAGQSYQWYNCATEQIIVGAVNDTLIASANGSYAVIVTSASGCSDTSDCMIVDQVGLYFPTSAVIALYPNPTSDFVTLELPAEDGAFAYVFDAQGKLIYQVENAKNGQQFDLSRLSTGVYTFRITLNNLSHIEKVVKQ